MKGPIAFVVQEMGNHDVSPAMDFAVSIKALLPPGMGQFSYDHAINMLKSGMAGLTDEDWLILSGDPVLIGLATVEMANRLNGHVRLLKWNRREMSYVPVIADTRKAANEPTNFARRDR